MRINKYIALSTGLSRRVIDKAIINGEVTVNNQLATHGQQIDDTDVVMMHGKLIPASDVKIRTILLNKPPGYVCSRNGQGSQTIYDLLPKPLYELKAVGRLDKDSSGLLLLTNNGQMAQELTHPRYSKEKVYEVRLDKSLSPEHLQTISQTGVILEDGSSKFELVAMSSNNRQWKVIMCEGRNRQIRRTFELLGYQVEKLHRITFGPYNIGNIPLGQYKQL